MTIREQAKQMGHEVVGRLKRVNDDVFTKEGMEIHYKQYTDDEATLYAVDSNGKLQYMAGGSDCWVM